MDKKQFQKIAEAVKGLRNQQEQLIIKHQPKFERGLVEAALEREYEIWQDLKAVFTKHNITPDFSSKIMSDNQPSKEANRPVLTCAGVMVNINYLVGSIDKDGKSGSLPDEAREELMKLQEQIDEEERKLEVPE